MGKLILRLLFKKLGKLPIPTVQNPVKGREMKINLTKRPGCIRVYALNKQLPKGNLLFIFDRSHPDRLFLLLL